MRYDAVFRSHGPGDAGAIARRQWRRPSARCRGRGADRGGHLLHRRDTDFALFNSRGVAAYYRETMARFSITAMAADSSGWAKASACDLRDLDPVALARVGGAQGGAGRASRANCRRDATP